jgi:hypothetical protein
MTSRLKAKMGAEIKTIHDKIKRRASWDESQDGFPRLPEREQ